MDLRFDPESSQAIYIKNNDKSLKNMHGQIVNNWCHNTKKNYPGMNVKTMTARQFCFNLIT